MDQPPFDSSKERINWLHEELDLAIEVGHDRSDWAITILVDWLSSGLIEKCEYECFLAKLNRLSVKKYEALYIKGKRSKKIL